MLKSVAIVATLDTKGLEVKYLKEKIEEQGLGTIIFDAGILGDPLGVEPAIDRCQIVQAAGYELDDLQKRERGYAVEAMMEGIKKVVVEAYSQGKIHGVLSVGGAEGTLIGTEAMKALPIGVPKLMVSTMASGNNRFGDYVGTKDITMMNSVTDILGLNRISKAVFSNAAGAIGGMVRAGGVEELVAGVPAVAISMYGNTTPCAMLVKSLLEKDGYEITVFHSNGSGGMALEELVGEGMFDAVIETSTHEITDQLFGGIHAAGPTRLEAAGCRGIPQVIIPGCLDYITMGSVEMLNDWCRERKVYYHNPKISLVRTTKKEMKRVGEVLAEKLNRARGPVAVAIPLGGFSTPNFAGGKLWDPEADGELVEALKSGLHSAETRIFPYHINDPRFAKAVVELFRSIFRFSSEKDLHPKTEPRTCFNSLSNSEGR